MTVLREDEFESFIKRKSAAMNGVLIHGADSSAVNALGQLALRGIVGAGDLSFATVRMDASSLKENPSRLDDEYRSLSLLGERRVILLDGVDDSHLKVMNSVLASDSLGNFIVLMADALGKSSKLRTAIEESATFASLAIYEEDVTALAARVRKLLSADSLKWGTNAEELFFALVGSDRSAVIQEAAKLALYCIGQGQITEADVEAVCGDTAAFGADELIDAVLTGDLEATDRMGSSLDSDSAGTRGIFSVLLLHLTRLQALRMDMERGMNAETAVRNAKPVIFFKRRNAFAAQLRNFDLQDLITMQQSVSAAMFQTRKMPDLFEAIVSRTLLSLARSARAKLN
jgi:DNA polymerase III subunit delta